MLSLSGHVPCSSKCQAPHISPAHQLILVELSMADRPVHAGKPVLWWKHAHCPPDSGVTPGGAGLQE